MTTATRSPKKQGKTTRDLKTRFRPQDFEKIPELPLYIADDFNGVCLLQGEAMIFLDCDEWATFLAGVRSGKIK